MSSHSLDAEEKMILGYYPLRGKCQVPRLLCEYLGLPYQNLFLTPLSWQNFRTTQKLNWIFEGLPFLMDKDFVVTQRYPICLYLIHKANRKDLLGRTLRDQIEVDIFMSKSEAVENLMMKLIKVKDLPAAEKEQALRSGFDENGGEALRCVESRAKEPFFLGYLSLVDFFIYESIIFLAHYLPEKISELPKLYQVYAEVAALTSIKDYEQSSRSVKQVCPIEYFQNWKQSHLNAK